MVADDGAKGNEARKPETIYDQVDRIVGEMGDIHGRPLPVAVMLYGHAWRNRTPEPRFMINRIVVVGDINGERLLRDVPVPSAIPSEDPTDPPAAVAADPANE
jgi:hypothetical protein